MDIEYLRYILLTAQAGSISHASRQLRLSHQHLSRIIATFEKDIGTTIFTRSRMGIIPTANGEQVLAKVRTIVKDIDALYTDFQPQRFDPMLFKEDVYVYSIQSFSQSRLSNHLINFSKMFPSAHFHLLEIPLHEIPDALAKTPIALGMPLAIYGADNLEQMFGDEVVCFPLAPLTLVALASKKNEAAQKYKSISLKALLEKDIVLYTPTALEDNPIYQILRYHGLAPSEIKYTASNINILNHLLDTQPNCFSIGLSGLPSKDDYLHIPLQKEVKVTYYVVVHKELLELTPIRQIINVFLAATNQPLLS